LQAVKVSILRLLWQTQEINAYGMPAMGVFIFLYHFVMVLVSYVCDIYIRNFLMKDKLFLIFLLPRGRFLLQYTCTKKYNYT
jgi:hypothetical protein